MRLFEEKLALFAAIRDADTKGEAIDWRGTVRPPVDVAAVRALGANRFEMKYSAGTLPHERMMRSIELYGREVIPGVHDLLTRAQPASSEEMRAASGG